MTRRCPYASPIQRARMHLAQAETRLDEPDAARDHLAAARRELDVLPVVDECPACGRAGLPERIVAHDC